MGDASQVPPAKDDALKSRVISHMNKDHAAELEHYLRAFNGLSASAASGAQLADISLDSMAITSASGSHTVAIDPPMRNLGESRVKLVEMAHAALRKLGYSDVRITYYVRPGGFDWVVFFGVALYFFCFATLPFVRRDTAAWEVLDGVFPFGAEAYRWLVKAIFVPVLAIHLTECWWMARTRLGKHRVQGLAWWAWLGSTFFEGFCAFQRFDGLVERERRVKEEKH